MNQHDRTEPRVTAAHLLHAVQRVRRQGVNTLMQALEADEPELIEHLLEELTAVHHELYRQGLPHKRLARTTRRFRRLLLVLVLAMRHSHAQDKPPPSDPSSQPTT